jgi:hypothetical protein
MMGNLDLWDKLKQPPTTALKTIGAGRLKGKSDINPQWRYQAMTEAFGPCGIGWTYEIKRLWREAGEGVEVFAFSEVAVRVKTVDEWSEPIPGIGGSMLVAKESSGPHNSDEAYKMATTDALSVALKMLGVAADVYLGNFDGSKYREPVVSGLPASDAALADVTGSDGKLSPPAPRGEVTKSGDGTRGALLEWRNKVAGLYVIKYPDKSDVFSVEDKKDITADMHPGGRDLEPSLADLDYVKGIFEKWEAVAEERLDVYHNGDSAGGA